MPWPFRRKVKTGSGSNDMRDTPIDNPLDFREDGSIREGDPAWSVMMEAMTSGKAVIANQRKDGTWDSKTVGD